VTPVEGTSAATPIFAGLASLLNDYRVANNKDTLGFLTPLLYAMSTANPSTFTDILYGNNTCTVSGLCCQVRLLNDSCWFLLCCCFFWLGLGFSSTDLVASSCSLHHSVACKVVPC
jgi:hypothetical protein